MQNGIVIHCQIFEDLITVKTVVRGVRVIEGVNMAIEGKEELSWRNKGRRGDKKRGLEELNQKGRRSFGIADI